VDVSAMHSVQRRRCTVFMEHEQLVHQPPKTMFGLAARNDVSVG